MLNAHPWVYVPRETHWIPTMHTAFGHTLQPLDAFTNVIDRIHHASGLRTIDNILEDFDFSRHDLYKRIRKSFGERSDSLDLVSVNTAIYRHLAEQKGKHYCGDKTPDYGFYMVMLQHLWPGSRFVHLVRDGRDAAVSMSRHGGFQQMVSLGVHNWCPVAFNEYYRTGSCRRRVRSAARRIWTVFTRQSRTAHLTAYIELWDSRIRRIADEATRLQDGTYIEVKYEDLVEDAKGALSRICTFAGLPCEDEWMTAATTMINSSPQAKTAMRRSDGMVLPPRCRSTLERFGYRL
jgi:hypothetical protein